MKFSGWQFFWIFILLMAAGVHSNAQTPGEWTWMHGDNASASPGFWGIQGISGPLNTPPALYQPCEWTDKNGNFWLFGGQGSGLGGQEYSALWKYEVAINEWTWMKGPGAIVQQPGNYGIQGVPFSGNYPGARGWGTVTWTDTAGNLWLFGGFGYDALGVNGLLNDLWKYDITTNEWTWVNGPATANDPGVYGTQGISSPANLPPSRAETSCSWTDNTGNLWLYGGVRGNSYLGDLWKYNIASNEWTWVHGANTTSPPAIYGTQGIGAPGNTPGGRMVYSSWTDLSGNLWLFGGGNTSVYNDLWKYDIAANEWTWMKGPNTSLDPGDFGTKCISAATNMPRARFDNGARVRDKCGNFWMMGGSRIGGELNDLWHYNVSTNEWTWVSGNQPEQYGTLGVSAPGNTPGRRTGNVAWIDNNGYIWVFGGIGISGIDNSLFRFVPDPNCVSVTPVVTVSSIATTICNGQNTTLTASASPGTSYTWSPGGQSTSSIIVSPGVSTIYTVIASNVCSSDSAAVTVTVLLLPAITVSSDTAICNGKSATLTAAGGTSYSWSPGGQSASSIVVAPVTSTSYGVTGSNACGTGNASVTVTVNPIPIATVLSTSVSCLGGNDGSATIMASSGVSPYSYFWLPTDGTDPVAVGLSAGVYNVIITDANGCTNLQTVTIDSPLNAEELYFPNAFSPNGDQENDVLEIYFANISCIKTFKLIIYNHWGEKVLQVTNPDFQWDGNYKGEILNTSVLVYDMRATRIDGKEVIRRGNISLVR